MFHYCKGSECGHSSHMSKGGHVEGVNRQHKGMKSGQSPMGSQVRKAHHESDPAYKKEYNERAKMIAYDTVKEGRNVAGGKSHRPLEGLADGGEVEELEPMKDMDGDHDGDMDGDDEIMDACADELMEALEKKDKRGILEAIKAIALNCRGE